MSRPGSGALRPFWISESCGVERWSSGIVVVVWLCRVWVPVLMAVGCILWSSYFLALVVTCILVGLKLLSSESR